MLIIFFHPVLPHIVHIQQRYLGTPMSTLLTTWPTHSMGWVSISSLCSLTAKISGSSNNKMLVMEDLLAWSWSWPIGMIMIITYWHDHWSGEYVLVRANSPKVKLDIQGRFEQVRAIRQYKRWIKTKDVLSLMFTTIYAWSPSDDNLKGERQSVWSGICICICNCIFIFIMTWRWTTVRMVR